MLVSASLLSADFSKLAVEVEAVTKAGSDWLHLDIMDGSFVPNITFGAMVVKSIRRYTNIPFDVHLMIENPAKYVDSFADAGANIIVPHLEADIHIQRTVTYIKKLGLKAGVSINPGTPVSALEEIIPFIDMVLIMSVNPGFPAQSLVETSYAKVAKVKKLINEINPKVQIQVDGGVNEKTAAKLAENGTDIAVAGSYIFSAEDYSKPIAVLKSL